MRTKLTPDAIAQARIRLHELFDQTLTAAHASSEPLLSITEYTPSSLQRVLASAHSSSASKYEAYHQRRNAGGPRELFPTKEHAREWLRLAAVVKYVDGGWISTIMNEVSGSPLRSDPSRNNSTARQAGKMAWQVISEEFGDGDLEKNHIYMYHALMDQLGVGARDEHDRAVPGHIRGFDGLKEDEGVERCWTAAVAQQCIGILSTEYCPEALGFNMAYETLPYHLLVTSRELRELDIDDTYFALHITIDNADSGHAALARLAVERYLEGVRSDSGDEAVQAAWKRVQAGFLLADCLPTTPWSPIEFEQINKSTSWRPVITPSATPKPANKTEAEMAKLMQRKAVAAEKMHCPSRMTIKKKTIEQWLDPKSLTEEKALEFVRAMAEARVMVKKGDVAGSRLMKELEWGGRMFGAFSRGEVEVVRRWIEGLGQGGQPKVTYGSFTGRTDLTLDAVQTPTPSSTDIILDHTSPIPATLDDLLSLPTPTLAPATFSHILPLWLTSLTLLEIFPASPTKLSTPLGMWVIRLVRSQQGFAPLHQPADICAGLDDFGMEYQHDVKGLWEIAEAIAGRELVLADELRSADEKIRRECEKLLAMRNRPYDHEATLLGLTLGFTRALHAQSAFSGMISGDEAGLQLRGTLSRIVREEIEAVSEFIERERSHQGDEERNGRYWRDFVKGYRGAVQMVVV